MVTAGNPHHSMLLTQQKEKNQLWSFLILTNKQKYVGYYSVCYETTINYYLTEENLLKFSIPWSQAHCDNIKI